MANTLNVFFSHNNNKLTLILWKLFDRDFESQAHVVLDANGSYITPIIGIPLYATHTIVVTYCVKLSKISIYLLKIKIEYIVVHK